MTNPTDLGFGALAIGAILLTLLLLGARMRRREDGWEAIIVCLALALGACLAVFGAFGDPRRFPMSWVTVLHEGREHQDVLHLTGRGVHAGPAFGALLRLASGGGPHDLREVVVLNLALLCVYAAGVLGIARHATRSWPAALGLSLASLLALPTVLTACSETPAAALAVLLVMGAIALAHVDDRASARPAEARLALALLVLVALLAASMRRETAFSSAPVVTIAFIRVLRGEEPLDAFQDRVRATFARALRASRRELALGVAVALLSLSPLLFPLENETAWIVEALHPLNPSFLTLPFFAAVLLVPVGTIALFALGAIHGLRRLFAFGLFPLGVIVTYRLYFSASHHAPFELLRYSTLLLPSLVLVSLFGFRELERWASRGAWPVRWRFFAIAALVALFGATPLFAVPAWLGWRDVKDSLPATPLDRDVQREVRFLLAARDAHPECALVAPVTRGEGAGRARGAWDVLVLGPHADVPTVHDAALDTQALVTREHPDTPCALLYLGLDCNLEGADCNRFGGGSVIEELTFDRIPYNDEAEYGAVRPVTRLVLRELSGRPATPRRASAGAPEHQDQTPRRRSIERRADVEVTETRDELELRHARDGASPRAHVEDEPRHL